MGKSREELLGICEELSAFVRKFDDDARISEPLNALEKAAKKTGLSWSGSWIGYHSRVYYSNLEPPPPGAHFSREWGMDSPTFNTGTQGDWREYEFNGLKQEIVAMSGNPDINPAEAIAIHGRELFKQAKDQITSILELCISTRSDNFLTSRLDKVKQGKAVTTNEIIEFWAPKGSYWSRDSLAISQGLQTPPHLVIEAEIAALRSPAHACKLLAELAKASANHLERLDASVTISSNVPGKHIFIGHGRSSLWKDLKDFLQDRLQLPWDEFNRVPVAGITNVDRLSEMLDSAAIAFIIMTAEDEQADGQLRARMNVVHEAGLFQGRLGFTKAIVLLEEGCEEFSNIQGLGQIRFPKGNITAVCEDVRRVLEREKILATTP